MIETPLTELEDTLGVRFYCLERWTAADGSRYFLASFDNRSTVTIRVLDVRSAGALTVWVNAARAIQGRDPLTEPFTPPTARRVLALMHSVAESGAGTCSTGLTTEGITR